MHYYVAMYCMAQKFDKVISNFDEIFDEYCFLPVKHAIIILLLWHTLVTPCHVAHLWVSSDKHPEWSDKPLILFGVCWAPFTQKSLKYLSKDIPALSLGTSRLCQHNFEHNRSLKALSIMPA